MLQTLMPRIFRFSSRVAAQASRLAAYSDFVATCEREGVASVLDIGANRGQFATRTRSAGWTGPIYSFEPTRNLHDRLKRAAATDPNWIIAERLALGDSPGRLSLNIASNDGKSSSLLPAETSGTLYGSSFEFVGTEEVDVVTLDSWTSEAAPAAPFAIKIDVQGFELHVLRGAGETLKRTRVVMLEAPLVSSYRGAASFDALYRFMVEQGFRVADAHASTLDPKDGAPLELDVTFVSERDG